MVSSKLGSILGLRDEEADVFYPISFLTSKGNNHLLNVQVFLCRINLLIPINRLRERAGLFISSSKVLFFGDVYIR